MKLFDPATLDPRSIDAIILKTARRRQTRERISMLFAGVIVTAMVVTFYRILIG